jgi:hypothetical protein
MKISWTLREKASRLKDMSDANQTQQKPRTTRFFLYIAGGFIIFVVILFIVGTLLTRVLWPAENSFMTPTPRQEN